MRANWFIGWPLSVPGLDERLGEAPKDVRLFAANDLHLTLAFLGPVGAERAGSAFDRLDVAALSRVDVSFGNVVVMGDPGKGTALAAELTDGGQTLTQQMRRDRDRLLAAAGARPEGREPLPHLTVARIGRRATPAARRAALTWAAALDLRGLGSSADRIALYTWSADRSRGTGNLFRIARERALGGSGEPDRDQDRDQDL